MSDSLRQALVEDYLVAGVFADEVLRVFADWLERRAVGWASDESDNPTVVAMRHIKASAVESLLAEVRQEIDHAG